MCFMDPLHARWTLDEKMPNLVSEFIYDEVLPSGTDYILVLIDKKWGVLDHSGKAVIPAKYAFIPWISGDYAVAAELDDANRMIFRIVDTRGNVRPKKYFSEDDALQALEEISDPSALEKAADESEVPAPDGYWSVFTHGRRLTYDTRKRLLLPCLHGFSIHLSDEYEAALEKDREYTSRPGGNRWGLIESRTGRPILPFAYEDINMIDRHLVKIKTGGKWGIADARISAFSPEIHPSRSENKGEEDFHE